MEKNALIIGATGLVGRELVQLLVEENKYKQITVLTRRKSFEHPAIKEVVADFNNLAAYKKSLEADDVFCCIGTTIKKAGSQAEMEKIDLHYPVEIASLLFEMGARQMLVISSIGANRNSKIFYSSLKGRLEESLKTIGYPSLAIFRPSLLLGKREEFRFGEKLSSYLLPPLSFLLVGPLRKYRGISAKAVAASMSKIAEINNIGVHIVESDEIERHARTKESSSSFTK
ncbi:NAD-dependent epimerase/dehydratase family protein [Niallia taxi]|uniref:NAD-dependent epimerase/dehydratase family protein n=1 Tax=Niallia taxi TaxID=2499688 RepID=UPI003D2E883E